MKTAKEIMGEAQAVSVLSTLLVFIGRAEKYKQQLGAPVVVRLSLNDPANTITAVNADLVMNLLQQRAQELMAELNTKGISTDEMLADIEKELEGDKKQH